MQASIVGIHHMHKESHKGYWGVMQAETGELLDVGYMECSKFVPTTSIHIIVNPAIAQPWNHPNLPLDKFELL
jgi:hypothetical protein